MSERQRNQTATRMNVQGQKRTGHLEMKFQETPIIGCNSARKKKKPTEMESQRPENLTLTLSD